MRKSSEYKCSTISYNEGIYDLPHRYAVPISKIKEALYGDRRSVNGYVDQLPAGSGQITINDVSAKFVQAMQDIATDLYSTRAYFAKLLDKNPYQLELATGREEREEEKKRETKNNTTRRELIALLTSNGTILTKIAKRYDVVQLANMLLTNNFVTLMQKYHALENRVPVLFSKGPIMAAVIHRVEQEIREGKVAPDKLADLDLADKREALRAEYKRTMLGEALQQLIELRKEMLVSRPEGMRDEHHIQNLTSFFLNLYRGLINKYLQQNKNIWATNVSRMIDHPPKEPWNLIQLRQLTDELGWAVGLKAYLNKRKEEDEKKTRREQERKEKEEERLSWEQEQGSWRGREEQEQGSWRKSTGTGEEQEQGSWRKSTEEPNPEQKGTKTEEKKTDSASYVTVPLYSYGYRYQTDLICTIIYGRYGYTNTRSGVDEQYYTDSYIRAGATHTYNIHQRYSLNAGADYHLGVDDMPRALHYFNWKPWNVDMDKYGDIFGDLILFWQVADKVAEDEVAYWAEQAKEMTKEQALRELFPITYKPL